MSLAMDDSTQPISQSFYETIIQKSKSTSIPEGEGSDPVEESRAGVGQYGSPETQRTLKQGDRGHVDIMSSYVTGREEAEEDQPESELVDFLPTQTQEQHVSHQFPESQRFKTPATASRKRRHNGEHTDSSTSLARNPLRRDSEPTPGKMMGLSQVFAGTQAVSSPLSNGLPTGPRSDRPSPHIDLMARLASAPDSSPLRPISDSKKLTTEPAVRYVSLRQSQMERERQAHQRATEERDSNGYDEFEDEPSYLARFRRIQEREKRIAEELKGFSSPIHQHSALPEHSRQSTPYPEPLGRESSDLSNTNSVGLPSEVDVTQRDSEDETDRNAELEMPATQNAPTIGDDDKENQHVNVPRTVTSDRLRDIINDGISHIDLSPSLQRISNTSGHTNMPSSGPYNIPNSQPGEYEPKQIGGHKPVASSEPCDQSEPKDSERFIDLTSQKADNETNSKRSEDAHARKMPADLSPRSDEMAAAANPTPVTIGEAAETVEETDSDLRRGVQESSQAGTDLRNRAMSITSHETAQANVIGDQAISANPDMSSQPVVKTPPGKRRRRLLDIGAEPSPLKLTPSFDVDRALQLDTDREAATFLSTSPLRRLTYSTKRRKTGDLAQIELPPEGSPSKMAPPARSAAATAISSGAEISRSSTGISQAEAQPSRSRRLMPPTTRISDSTPDVSVRRSIWDLEDSPRKPKAQANQRRKMLSPSNKSLKSTLATGSTATGAITPPAEHDSDQESGRAPSSEQSHDAPEDDIVAPHMVFACFNGKIRAYYPATFLGLSADNTRKYRIQWDGYAPDEVDVYGVKALDIRVGDTVKVDMAKVPKVPYVVRGFKDKITQSSSEVTDVRGYRTVIVVPKQRKPPTGECELAKEVPISAIYLDNNMWNQMKNRNLDPTTILRDGPVSCATPSGRVSTPDTPSSRHRRPPVSTAAASVATNMPPIVEGVFSKMAFAISYDDSARKNKLVNLVQSHGGLVLTESFYELLEPERLEVRAQYHDLGFTALLTERYSRKEKYMSALALGVPCLSGRWIEACVAAQDVVDWRIYLLPAGESEELEGAVRSRILPDIDACSVKLTEMLASRARFLTASAVVVMGRGKAEVKRAPYVWLVRAMGAEHVEKVTDAQAALQVVQDNRAFSWVFVDEREVESARLVFQTFLAAGKKARRKSGTHPGNDPTSLGCRVFGNALITQSLILGRLFES